ncbi:hypothetical protein ABZX40_17835 [Streptomyces sp. NPDC004610]|uniref:hypothetical protein n=1 Tax=unclassified Streptomyces TaxID=2593676 RepID=UPI0033B955F9
MTAAAITDQDQDARDAVREFETLTAGMDVEERDPAELPDGLADKILAVYVERRDGARPELTVFSGQDPVIRLHVVRHILAQAEVSG